MWFLSNCLFFRVCCISGISVLLVQCLVFLCRCWCRLIIFCIRVVKKCWVSRCCLVSMVFSCRWNWLFFFFNCNSLCWQCWICSCGVLRVQSGFFLLCWWQMVVIMWLVMLVLCLRLLRLCFIVWKNVRIVWLMLIVVRLLLRLCCIFCRCCFMCLLWIVLCSVVFWCCSRCWLVFRLSRWWWWWLWLFLVFVVSLNSSWLLLCCLLLSSVCCFLIFFRCRCSRCWLLCSRLRIWLSMVFFSSVFFCVMMCLQSSVFS